MNIRVYKIVYPKGKSFFISNDGYNNVIISDSIEKLAKITKKEIKEHFKEIYNSFSLESVVFIDFVPPHDIECVSNNDPKLCIALSQKEKQKFWKHYNS